MTAQTIHKLPRSWKNRLARIAIALVVVFVAAEVLLRVGLGLGTPVVYRLDPACGTVPSPNQHVRRWNVRNDINAFSMRGAEIAAQKPPGVYRVMFVGDSVTYGTTLLDQARIFTTLVRQTLAEKSQRPVEVLNASQGGWAPSNEVAYVRSRGTFGSDVVVFVFNTEDLVQPFAPRGAVPLEEDAPRLALTELSQRYVLPYLNLNRRAAEHRDARSTAGMVEDQSVPEAVRALSLGKTIVSEAGARLAVVYMPFRGAHWEGLAYQRALFELRNWTKENRVPLLDLSEAMAGKESATLYDAFGLHPTEAGHAVIADAIGRAWPRLTMDE